MILWLNSGDLYVIIYVIIIVIRESEGISGVYVEQREWRQRRGRANEKK
jgi:hypothetical protein